MRFRRHRHVVDDVTAKFCVIVSVSRPSAASWSKSRTASTTDWLGDPTIEKLSVSTFSPFASTWSIWSSSSNV
jgi:hypothetical protein